MQNLLPLLGIFAVFSPALLLPGPDFVAVVRNTVARGPRAGILTALGVSLGITAYAGLSAAGLSILFARLEWLEVIVRLAGAGFLSFLGIGLLRTPAPGFDQSTPEQATERPGGRERNPVLLGLIVNLTNPKAIIFFASIFGTAIRPQTPPWVLTVAVTLVGVCGLVWFSTVSLLTASTGMLISLQRHQHWIERLAGLAFLGFALVMAIDLAIAAEARLR